MILYCDQGKYEQAEPLYVRTLTIWEQQVGTEHFDTAFSVHGLAVLSRNRHKYEKAEPMYVRALRVRELTMGNDHPDVAETLHEFAILQQIQGHHEVALPQQNLPPSALPTLLSVLR